MTMFFAILAVLFLAAAIFAILRNKKLEDDILRIQKDAETSVAQAQQETERCQQQCELETQRIHAEAQSAIAEAKKQFDDKCDQLKDECEKSREHYASETQRVYSEAQSAVTEAQKELDKQFAELKEESEKIREHYELEARKSQEAAEALLAKTLKELEPLRKYESLHNAEEEVKRVLADAMSEATALRRDAQALLDETRTAAANERAQAAQKAKDIREQADAILNQAVKDAGRIVSDAEKKAEQLAGDAYTALRDKQLLEQAAAAIRNVIEGYGDRYVIPTQSLLDELAVEFGFDAAGQSLRSARELSRRMVEQGQAATCDYAEKIRRETAIRFVTDAFNGAVDTILSRSRHDNFGTLEQEIRDAFSLVNLNGQAFRNARILPAYLDARIAELKWAVIVHELARKQREEQRYLKEKLRDEEKARKEYDEKMRQATKEEELKQKAVEEAERKFATASAEQKAHYEQELQRLRGELVAATQQKITIAQMTKKGHVYIISNVGSFGEGIYKIGQTRRPDPQERVDELGDASVPFEFDIHALIESDNAPALEHKIHKKLLAMQVNKLNPRKEFFRVNLASIHQEIEKLKQGEDFTLKLWTDKAIATEYRESLDIENNPERKQIWLKKQEALADRQIKLDLLRIPTTPAEETDEENLENGSDDKKIT